MPAEGAPCPLFHQAVELIGKRWTGAIVQVLMAGPMRFSEISHSVPDISDRLLSQRVKELEAHGLIARTVVPGPPLRVEYSLTDMGAELAPALEEIRLWACRWLAASPSSSWPRPSASPAPVGPSPIL